MSALGYPHFTYHRLCRACYATDTPSCAPCDGARARDWQQVDAVAEKDLGQRFGVTGFPSLKYFPPGDGEVETYSGGRDLNSLVEFLNKKARLVGGAGGGERERRGYARRVVQLRVVGACVRCREGWVVSSGWIGGWVGCS